MSFIDTVPVDVQPRIIRALSRRSWLSCWGCHMPARELVKLFGHIPLFDGTPFRMTYAVRFECEPDSHEQQLLLNAIADDDEEQFFSAVTHHLSLCRRRYRNEHWWKLPLRGVGVLFCERARCIGWNRLKCVAFNNINKQLMPREVEKFLQDASLLRRLELYKVLPSSFEHGGLAAKVLKSVGSRISELTISTVCNLPSTVVHGSLPHPTAFGELGNQVARHCSGLSNLICYNVPLLALFPVWMTRGRTLHHVYLYPRRDEAHVVTTWDSLYLLCPALQSVHIMSSDLCLPAIHKAMVRLFWSLGYQIRAATISASVPVELLRDLLERCPHLLIRLLGDVSINTTDLIQLLGARVLRLELQSTRHEIATNEAAPKRFRLALQDHATALEYLRIRSVHTPYLCPTLQFRMPSVRKVELDGLKREHMEEALRACSSLKTATLKRKGAQLPSWKIWTYEFSISNAHLRRLSLIIHFGCDFSFRSSIIFINSFLRRVSKCSQLKCFQVTFRASHSENPWCEWHKNRSGKERARMRQQIIAKCSEATSIRDMLSTVKSQNVFAEVVETFSGIRIQR